MKKVSFLVLVAAFQLLFCFSTRWNAGAEEGWKDYRLAEYGLQMSIPKGSVIKIKEFPRGWAGAYAEYEHDEFWGLAKQGATMSADEMVSYGATISGIPESYWKTVDEVKDVNGWTWYSGYKAVSGGKVVYAGLGTGPKGSYLMILKTTPEEASKSWNTYEIWYKTLKIF